MTEKEKNFYKDLDIEEEDKIRAKKFLSSKGIEKHLKIKKWLLNWSDERTIKYTKIASVYRYDKRLRLVLFKFLSYLEELYRGTIVDNFDIIQTYLTIAVKKRIEQSKEKNLTLDEIFESIGFAELLNQCNNLPKEIKNNLFAKNEHISTNLKALRILRNAVMHNKFLLLQRGYEKCYVVGVDDGKGAGLRANILNLIQFLPKEVGKKCADDIDSCKEDRNVSDDTKWDLPPQVVISIYI